MFRRSVVLLACVLVSAVGIGFYQQWQAIGRLPSRYDTGLTLDQAFKQAKTPLLVEFYSDSCATCQRVTPVVHQVAETMPAKLTLVMVDVANPDNQMYAQLFGVTDIPRVFVFDPKKMKKQALPNSTLQDEQALKTSLDKLI